MYCQKCGAENTEESIFCTKWGTRLNKIPEEQAYSDKKMHKNNLVKGEEI